MALSRRAIETLIDLAENKLTSICSFDREDLREVRELELCIRELNEMRAVVAPRQVARKPLASSAAAQ